MTPLVSVIIPVYNVELYIKDCLSSVLRQSYSNIEVLVVDDCGTDKSMEMVSELVDVSDRRVKILRHEHNRGLSAARNTGIENSSGEYVYFLDSDDWIEDNCIETMVSMGEKYSGVDIVFAGANEVNDGRRRYGFMNFANKSLPEYADNPLWIKQTMLERYALSMTSWNRLVRRDFIIANKLYFAEGLVHEDELWNYQLAKYASKVAICGCNTYFYRIRENSIVLSEKKEAKISSIIAVLKAMADSIDPCLANVQVKSIWSLAAEIYELAEGANKTKLDEIMIGLRCYLNLVDRATLILYVKHKKIYDGLLRVPKIRGMLNISRRIHMIDVQPIKKS